MNDEFNLSYDELRNMTWDGKNPEAAFNMGLVAEKHNDYEGAIGDYTSAIKYKPDFVKAYLRRAKCYERLNMHEKAIIDYESVDKYIEKSKKDMIKIGIGNNYADLGKFDIALNYIEEAVVINPNDPANYFFRARINEALGYKQRALIDYTIFLEKKPNEIEGLNERGRIRWELGDLNGAITDYSKIIELAPNIGEPYYHRGVIFIKINEREDGILDLERASMLGVKDARYVLDRI